MVKIPKRWENYLPVGCRVPGTRFLPFKVPLKQELCHKQPENERFTPSLLVESNPMLKAVIDLTDTNRYYNSEEFTSRGVLYKKINIIGGGRLPSEQKCKQFFDAVDQFSETLGQDSDALIGVHCTHGLNRTGYLICKYMVSRLKIDPQEAISKFQEARGYSMERKNFVHDIMYIQNSHVRTPSTPSENWRAPPSANWRTESRDNSYPYESYGSNNINYDRNDRSHDTFYDRSHKRSYGSHDRSYGSHDRSYGSLDRSYGSNDRSYRSHDKPYDRSYRSHNRFRDGY